MQIVRHASGVAFGVLIGIFGVNPSSHVAAPMDVILIAVEVDDGGDGPDGGDSVEYPEDIVLVLFLEYLIKRCLDAIVLPLGPDPVGSSCCTQQNGRKQLAFMILPSRCLSMWS